MLNPPDLSWYPIRSDDVFVATYPKSGTTWMLALIRQIKSDGTANMKVYEDSPYFERSVSVGESFNHIESPRVFKTHYPRRLLPKARYIYVARNGLDVVVSYYHHCLGVKRGDGHEFSGSFSYFFDLFMRGDLVGGSWFEHVRDWSYPSPDVLFVTYSDMKTDLSQVAEKVSRFLRLGPVTNQILDRVSFESMKAHEKDLHHPDSGFKNFSFLRSGASGGWRDYVSESQHVMFLDEAKKHGLESFFPNLA